MTRSSLDPLSAVEWPCNRDSAAPTPDQNYAQRRFRAFSYLGLVLLPLKLVERHDPSYSWQSLEWRPAGSGLDVVHLRQMMRMMRPVLNLGDAPGGRGIELTIEQRLAQQRRLLLPEPAGRRRGHRRRLGEVCTNSI